MFNIHCTCCERDHLVGSDKIRSRHRTSEGTIAYVECPDGHLAVVSFGRRTPSAETELSLVAEVGMSAGESADAASAEPSGTEQVPTAA